MTDIGQAVSNLKEPSSWKAGGLVLVGFFVSDAIMPNLTKRVPVGESNLHAKAPEVNGVATAVVGYAMDQQGYTDGAGEMVAYGGLASSLDHVTERAGVKSTINNAVQDVAGQDN